jgi:hypothetical protein
MTSNATEEVVPKTDLDEGAAAAPIGEDGKPLSKNQLKKMAKGKVR